MSVVVSKLSKRYGPRWVIKDLSFSVDRGASLAIVGPSGSGKTTLLNCLSGSLKPDAGSICVDEREIVGLRGKALREYRARQLGVVYQHGNLLSELTAVENAALPLLAQGVSDHERARSLVLALGIPDPDEQAENLSGGERQRVALARALVSGPQLVLADEPTGALDALTRDRVADLIFSQFRDLNASLIISTHDMVVARMADHMLELEKL
ncbi:ABC transporter ATP-binding protein [Bowdeniella massiliensis]|uniref:ABC transporter ATP-binding protein n=1 Tax=Bowdeniella massiliensis TaxID=2932264 RepID=UPI00202979E3|nr:ABC transporter ATP-binding protein [Bowdeniella massiliensis]